MEGRDQYLSIYGGVPDFWLLEKPELLLALLTSLKQRDTMRSRLDVSCYSATLTSAATK